MKDRDVPLPELDASLLAEVELSRLAKLDNAAAFYLDRLNRLADKPTYKDPEKTSISVKALTGSNNALRYVSDA